MKGKLPLYCIVKPHWLSVLVLLGRLTDGEKHKANIAASLWYSLYMYWTRRWEIQTAIDISQVYMYNQSPGKNYVLFIFVLYKARSLELNRVFFHHLKWWEDLYNVTSQWDSVSGSWTSQEANESINFLTMMAIYLALSHFSTRLQGQSILIQMVNLTCVSYHSSGYMRSHEQQRHPQIQWRFRTGGRIGCLYN